MYIYLPPKTNLFCPLSAVFPKVGAALFPPAFAPNIGAELEPGPDGGANLNVNTDLSSVVVVGGGGGGGGGAAPVPNNPLPPPAPDAPKFISPPNMLPLLAEDPPPAGTPNGVGFEPLNPANPPKLLLFVVVVKLGGKLNANLAAPLLAPASEPPGREPSWKVGLAPNPSPNANFG
jgi:hypothetical protein